MWGGRGQGPGGWQAGELGLLVRDRTMQACSDTSA